MSMRIVDAEGDKVIEVWSIMAMEYAVHDRRNFKRDAEFNW